MQKQHLMIFGHAIVCAQYKSTWAGFGVGLWGELWGNQGGRNAWIINQFLCQI